jgi:hypothetical protein
MHLNLQRHLGSYTYKGWFNLNRPFFDEQVCNTLRCNFEEIDKLAAAPKRKILMTYLKRELWEGHQIAEYQKAKFI